MTKRKPRKPVAVAAKMQPPSELTEKVEEEVAKILEPPAEEVAEVILSASEHYADLGSPPQPAQDDDDEDLDPSVWWGTAAPIYQEVLADTGIDPEQNRLHTHDRFLAERNQDEWLAKAVSESLFAVRS